MYIGRIAPNLKNLEKWLGVCIRPFISSVRSSSVYIRDPAAATFPNFSNLEHSCFYTYISFSFHFDSVINIQNRTMQCFCLNYIDHAYIFNFFKILQGSSNFFKTQHMLYFLNAGGSWISNMTFLCV